MAVLLYQAIKPDGKALWEEERPLSWLLDKKARMPGPMFNAQYMNDPSGLRGVLYDLSWLHFYNPRELPPLSELIGVQSGDPATSEDESSNYFGHCTIGKHADTGLVYILGFDFGHIPATKHMEFLRGNHHAWRAKGLPIERVWLEEAGPQQGTTQNLAAQTRHDPKGSIPLDIYKPKGSKQERFDSILYYLGNGTILFPGTSRGELIDERGFNEFKQEFTTFPRGKRDDLMDALYVAVHEIVGTTEGAMFTLSELREEQDSLHGTGYGELTLDEFDGEEIDLEYQRVVGLHFNMGWSLETIVLETGIAAIEVADIIRTEKQIRASILGDVDLDESVDYSDELLGGNAMFSHGGSSRFGG